MKLGAIGDDFTGSSDLGLTLRAGGMHTVQYVGIPDTPADADVDAGIVALKSRSIPVAQAVSQSLDALQWLQAQGCTQFFFKYCSTFDSTREGNIGPVIEALIKALGTSSPVIVCPAFPTTGRTLYQGHLFVGDTLLSESGMQYHPITPMTDSDCRRWLSHQTSGNVGHLPLATLRAGTAQSHLQQLADSGQQMVVCDAVSDEDLLLLADASVDCHLITGGSGIALGLPAKHGSHASHAVPFQGSNGPAIALSGSCSNATRQQIAAHKDAGGAAWPLEVAQLANGAVSATDAIAWAQEQSGLPLIYSSANPDDVTANQQALGNERSAELIEQFFANCAREAVAAGFQRIIAAGGETSGAVIEALNVDALHIGPMIDPGVPALAIGGTSLAVALKSGNFGATDFFAKAAAMLTNTTENPS